ncbi:phage terminase small subunit P27 family [Citrobacter cronae]|uniref:phage terminase small subunit P27 family n=1 Tax=Citrobacter cronae TaxID=1748967 RepID=UPI0021D0F761|nr:phage terminase small subunit P27 family [Citrobacter cronae]MCU6199107.1 phage terminase small subunit P27 family [Citrobacter cronae]
MGAVRSSGGGRKRNLPVGQKSGLTRIMPPDELMGDVAVRLWKTQSKILIERGVFELEDAPLLVAYCNAFHLMIEAEGIIAREGITEFSDQGGKKKHPAINVRNDSVSQIARLGSLLGLDPMSRIRMTTGNKEPEDEGNEFDEF